VAKTADHLADSATIAFCGINADDVSHASFSLLGIGYIFSGTCQIDVKKIGSRLIGNFLSIGSNHKREYHQSSIDCSMFSIESCPLPSE
jgi:hypothetical protein